MDLYQFLHIQLINNLKRANINEHYTHYILTKNLNPSSVLIDLGANEGKFYSLLNSKYSCTCHVVEASPLLFKNLPLNKKTIPYHYAIGKHEGPITFFLSGNPEANSLYPNIAIIGENVIPVEVEGITFENFLKKAYILSRIEILKIDIEGAELDVLENISTDSLEMVAQIAVEFHDFIIKDDTYFKRMKLLLKKLRDNNFMVVKVSNADWRAVLLINTNMIQLGFIQKLRLKIIHPFLQSLMTLYRKAGEVRHADIKRAIGKA